MTVSERLPPPAPAARAGRRRRGQATARWLLRRLLLSVFVLFAVSVLIFAATQALPGDPALEVLGHGAQPAQLAALRHQLGLDHPLLSQYGHWLDDFPTGRLGNSLTTGQSVGSLLLDRGLASMTLVVSSAVIAIPLALVLGTLAAVRRDRPFDHATQVVLLVLTALPEFVIGLILLILFATSVFKVLPAVAIVPSGGSAYRYPRELVLPVVTLVLAVLPYLARLQRAAMIDVLESEYVQMARLKGLPERLVIRRHALRNSVVPIVQGSALALIYLTGGIVTIEYLFGYPGLGAALTTAVEGRDIPVIQAVVLLMATVYVIVNLVADLLTVFLIPRLRIQRG